MEISDFSKWWNRNQAVIEDGFMAPVMLNASRVAQMAFDAGVASEKAHATTRKDKENEIQ